MKVVRDTTPPADAGNSTPPAGETLDGLELDADLLDAGGEPGQAPPGPGADDAAPKVTNATFIAATLEGARDVFCMVSKLESPKRVFTANEATALGEAWGRVCDKRRLDLQALMGDWGLEVVAAMLTFQVLSIVREAVRVEIASKNAPPPEEPETVS
jgi:hypothetical protein